MKKLDKGLVRDLIKLATQVVKLLIEIVDTVFNYFSRHATYLGSPLRA